MKLTAIMLAAVTVAAFLVSSNLAFVTSPVGTSPVAFAKNALAKTAASQPTLPRSIGSSPVGPLNIKIIVGEEENVDAALMRFRRSVSRSGLLQDLRWRRHFETTAEKKKRKRVENLRKEKIQRARERKFRKNNY